MRKNRKNQPDSDVLFNRRAIFAGMCYVGAFSVLSARIFMVQHAQHDKWTLQMESTRRDEEIIPAPRGSIFDSRQRLLACDEMVESVVFDNIFLNPRISKGAMERMAQALALAEQKADQRNGQRYWVDIRRAWNDEELRERYIWWVANTIAPALGRSAKEIAEAITQRTNSTGARLPVDSGETVLTKELPATQALALKKLLRTLPLDSLRVRSTFRRVYPQNRPLTHLVGLINAEGKPVFGVEAAMFERMAGKPGLRRYEKDGRGKELGAFPHEVTAPVPGRSLKLTIDTQIQEIVEQTLDERGSKPAEIYVPDLKAKRVTVVLLDAQTMAVRAIACRRADLKENGLLLFNPATQEPYEPGSTLKVITLASALDTGKIDPNTMIQTHLGVYEEEGIDTIHDDDPHAQLSATDVLVHSSNIGAFKLARTVGLKKFHEYLTAFGLGERTGVECNCDKKGNLESRGIVHPVKDWNYNAMSRASFGYGIAATPLQMCAAMGVILNDGWYKKPYLVEAVMDETNKVLEQTPSEGLRRIISEKAARQTRDAMLAVVERGTGTRAQSEDFYIAGKTGTARRAGKNGYVDGEYIVSFLGFAPAHDPMFLGLVVIDSPEGDARSLYGGKMAAPVFRRIMERCLRYSEVPSQNVAHSPKPQTH